MGTGDEEIQLLTCPLRHWSILSVLIGVLQGFLALGFDLLGLSVCLNYKKTRQIASVS